MTEKKYMRLTITERRGIEQGLKAGTSICLIATSLGRSTSTVTREVMRNAVHRKTGGGWEGFNDCENRHDCDKSHICSNEECTRSVCCGCEFCFYVCKDYVKERCIKIQQPPYVCNGCKSKRLCTLEKALYKAGVAQRSADEVLRNSRSGIDMTEEERKRLDDIVSPLIKQGQSPYHIVTNNKDSLMISEKTLYTYIAANIFTVASTELRCKVGMKPRKAKPALRVDRACTEGRTREDFLKYIEENPDVEVAEMDSVIGKRDRGEKVLLTVHFPHSEFMLAFIRDANTAKSVSEVFSRLRATLPHGLFSRVFPVIVTDRGSEFTDPAAVERDEKGRLWTRVFYCDPNCSYQKPYVENGHRMIRMVLPKGSSFNGLTQEKVDLMMSHINSYARKALGGRTPIDVFASMHGKEAVKKLGLWKISANNIILKPSLIK